VPENLAVLVLVVINPQSSRRVGSCWGILRRQWQFKGSGEIDWREVVLLATFHYRWRKLYFPPVADGDKQVSRLQSQHAVERVKRHLGHHQQSFDLAFTCLWLHHRSCIWQASIAKEM
jgi:hypothetical protein